MFRFPRFGANSKASTPETSEVVATTSATPETVAGPTTIPSSPSVIKFVSLLFFLISVTVDRLNVDQQGQSKRRRNDSMDEGDDDEEEDDTVDVRLISVI